MLFYVYRELLASEHNCSSFPFCPINYVPLLCESSFGELSHCFGAKPTARAPDRLPIQSDCITGGDDLATLRSSTPSADHNTEGGGKTEMFTV